MSFLGGIFARNNPSAKSKSASDLHASSHNSSNANSPTISHANSQYSNGTGDPFAAASSASSPTADYISFAFSSAGPSSPNGRGLAYAGDSPLNNPNNGNGGRGREGKKEKGGLGFFGRKRSKNEMRAVLTPPDHGDDGASDAGHFEEREGRPSYAYMSRMSTSSELPPATSPSDSDGLRPPWNLGGGGASTRSLPPPQLHPLGSPTSSLAPSNYAYAPGHYTNSSSGSASQYAPKSPHSLHGAAGNYAHNPGSHSHLAGSPLAPSISPTKSAKSGVTTRSTGAKSVGAKSGRRFAFWSRGPKSTASTPTPPSPASTQGRGAGGAGGESEFNLKAFRHVSPAPPSPSPNSQSRGKGVPLTSSNLSALEASDRYPTAEDLAAPRRPRPRGGSDASASSSRISVAAFREVHARRSAAGSPAFDGPGGGSTANLGAGMGGGSSRDLPRENLNRSRENLGMTVGNRSRENLGGGGMYNLANASRSQGNQAQQGRDRPQRETPPQQQQRQQSGPQQQQQQQQRTPPQQYPQQGQQTPQKAPPPPAKTTPGKHYQQRAQTQSNVSQTQRREQTQRANTQPQPPPQQNTPNKKTGQGHTREAQQWQSDTSASEDENEDGSAPSSAEPTDSNSKKPPPLGRAAKSDAGHGHREAPRAASSLGVYGMGAPPSASVSTGNVATTNVARPAVATSKRLSQPVLPALQIPSSAPIRPQAPPQQRRPPPPAATSSESSSESEEEDSDDDAPLATLVAPRRPGSALSSFSGSNPNLVGSHTNLAASTNLPPSPLPPHHPGHKHSGSQSGSSIASSSRPGPNKPKPLIDITELTASRPTQVSQKDGGKDDGFTGGGMLASALGGKASTNKLETEASNPVLTSRSPPVRSETGLVHFPSPPSSPAKEVPPRVLGSAGAFGPPASRSSPMRRETAGSAASLPAPAPPPARSTSPASGSGSAVQKRDILSERLRAAAAASASTERVGFVEKLPQEEKTPPPPAAFATATARKAFHRRSSSDIISPPKRTWADDGDNYRDSVLGRDLADMLGGGIALVTRDGTATPERSKSLEKKKEEEEHHDKDSIAPIVIKQRSPPPSFSVTSRPAHLQNRSIGTLLDLGSTPPRQRSSTLVPVSSSSTFGGSTASGTTTASTTTSSSSRSPPIVASPPSPSLTRGTSTSASKSSKSTAPPPGQPRQRSSTMMSLGQQTQTTPPPVPAAAPPTSILASVIPPVRPFAAPRMQRNSPASSTGDSSSGPAPLTPRDGSDFGSSRADDKGREKEEKWSGGVSGLVPRRAAAHQRRSVSFDFEEDVPGDGKGKAKARAKPRETPLQEEERRRERRRSEARAAIELGNVINGPGPVDDDEDEDNEEDVAIKQGRMGPMMNPMGMGMGMGMGMPMNNMQMGMQMPMGYGTPPNAMSPGWPGWGQQQQAGTPNMLSPAQFMVPPPADPAFYAAHQQAMMIAKQAYQMAVAQQAMAVAGEEWERGSTVGGLAGRGSVYGGGGGSVYGGGGGSVYGGGSVMGGMQGMSMGGWSPGGGQLFPPAPRSMYGGGGARSEYGGGGGGGGNWSSSRSVYGETFGPSTERYTRSSSSGNLAAQGKGSRESGYFPPVSSSPGRQGPSTQRQRTASQPATPPRNPGAARRPPPPSSWKPGA